MYCKMYLIANGAILKKKNICKSLVELYRAILHFLNSSGTYSTSTRSIYMLQVLVLNFYRIQYGVVAYTVTSTYTVTYTVTRILSHEQFEYVIEAN